MGNNNTTSSLPQREQNKHSPVTTKQDQSLTPSENQQVNTNFNSSCTTSDATTLNIPSNDQNNFQITSSSSTSSLSSNTTTSYNAPNLVGESKILIGEKGKSIIQQLRLALPQEQKQHNEWTLLYANWRNGASIATFGEIVMHHGPMIIIIEDIEGNIFGAFTSVSLDRKPNFYGNNNCLLFKIETNENQETNVQIYRSSNRNENYVYFNYGNKYNPYNGLAFGGKMGCFSLCIEEDWRFGRTVGDLLTYSYSPQLSSDSDFEINHIEAWIFPLSESIQIDLRYRAKAKQSKQALGEDNAAEIFIMK